MRIFAFSLLLFFSLRSVSLFAQNDEQGWTLTTSEDAMQIFSRPQEASPINEYKGFVILRGDIDAAFAVLSDYTRLAAKDPFITKTEILQTVSETECYVYQQIKTPFFLKDRDVVLRVHTQKTANGYFQVSESVPDYIPEKASFTRMKDTKILVSLVAMDAHTFKVTYKSTYSPEELGDLAVNFANKALAGSTLDRLRRIRETLIQQLILARGE